MNPNWSQSSPDGTQSDTGNRRPSQATMMCKDGFSFNPRDGFHSCVINFTVSCHLRPSLSNGVANGDMSEHGTFTAIIIICPDTNYVGAIFESRLSVRLSSPFRLSTFKVCHLACI